MKIFSKFIFTPYDISLSIENNGGVPSTQSVNSIGTLYPDYTITPLTLDPVLSVFDPDTGESLGNDMENAATVVWQQIEGNTVTEITSSNSAYTIASAGANRGRLQLKQNLSASGTRVLRCKVSYFDPRRGETVEHVATYKVTRRNDASARPRLRLDVPRALEYNPLRDSSEIKITARLTSPGKSWKAPVNCGFIWEKWTGSAWRRILSPSDAGYEIMDYDVSISGDTSYITVSRDRMGSELRIRCRAWYLDPQTNNPVGALSASFNGVAPTDEVFLKRNAKFKVDVQNVGWRMSNGTRSVRPKAVISDIGNIENVSELDFRWKAGMSGATLKDVATGQNPEISVPLASSGTFEMDLDVKDRGSWCAAQTADGKILTLPDGSILLIR